LFLNAGRKDKQQGLTGKSFSENKKVNQAEIAPGNAATWQKITGVQKRFSG